VTNSPLIACQRHADERTEQTCMILRFTNVFDRRILFTLPAKNVSRLGVMGTKFSRSYNYSTNCLQSSRKR